MFWLAAEVVEALTEAAHLQEVIVTQKAVAAIILVKLTCMDIRVRTELMSKDIIAFFNLF